jgi:hypothetical protein
VAPEGSLCYVSAEAHARKHPEMWGVQRRV